MVVAETKPKESSTMLWVQASALQQQFNQCQVHEKGTEWYYIPRPSLSLPSRTSSRRESEDSSSAGQKQSWRDSRNSSLAYSTHPGVHGITGPASSSSVSTASSQVSGNSGQPLVTPPTWLPPHPPALISKDDIAKQDPELGGVVPSLSRKCDGDNISIASSTHFTMIEGARARGRPSGGCCSHSHRITALVLTMSVIFLVGITVAVLLLEMRIRYYNVR